MTATRAAAACFIVSILASIGMLPLYLSGGDTQLEGVLLGAALGGLGLGVSIWALFLLDAPVATEERHPLSPPEPGQAVWDPATRRWERVPGETTTAPVAPAPPAGPAAGATTASDEPVTRRRFLGWLLGGAAGLLAAALAIPTLSLGPQPGRALFRTSWSRGLRVVTADGDALRPADVAFGSVTTVFPEGHVGSADAVGLLVRVRRDELQLSDERRGWAPEGALVYSKVCTHAGCPVGLYRAETQELLCPCHQSTFDVLRGAVPTHGPAARPLPQLPLEVDDAGYLVAGGDYPEPVGPSFWNVTHRDPA